MLNDWCWVKVDDSEYKLNDNNGNTASMYLVDLRFCGKALV